jgi:hypothetical protein
MPPRSAEEKARRKLQHEQKLAARKLKKEKEDAEKKKAEEEKALLDDDGANNNDNDVSETKDCHLVALPEDPLHNILQFLPARDLGAFSMTCRQLNFSMVEGRTHHLFSRLKAVKRSEGPGQLNVPIKICENEIQVKELLIQALEGCGDTGRLVTKKAKKGKGVCADEYMAYARFVEEAVLGRSTQVSFDLVNRTIYFVSEYSD